MAQSSQSGRRVGEGDALSSPVWQEAIPADEKERASRTYSTTLPGAALSPHQVPVVPLLPVASADPLVY